MKPYKPIVGPLVLMTVAAALLFLFGVLIATPLAGVISKIRDLGWAELPFALWVRLGMLAVGAGAIWSVAWITFKHGEKKVLEAFDERRGHR